MAIPHHKYICIEGNIGTGKTTLCQFLARDWDSRIILEQFTDNPFLPLFYGNPERYAFQVELFFMSERFKQLQETQPVQTLFDEIVVADYFFTKTLLFASKNLSEDEFKLFGHLYEVMAQRTPKPDLLVYLHRSVDRLYEQIQSRDREIEKSIQKSYLTEIQNAYFEYFRHEVTYPVLILDIESLDFESNETHYRLIKDFIIQPYNPGVHRISLVH